MFAAVRHEELSGVVQTGPENTEAGDEVREHILLVILFELFQGDRLSVIVAWPEQIIGECIVFLIMCKSGLTKPAALDEVRGSYEKYARYSSYVAQPCEAAPAP